MSKALIICVAGMSSSLMAQKQQTFQNQGKDITVEAISSNEGEQVITDATYDLYLVSPQAGMYYNQFAAAGENQVVQLLKFRHKLMFQSQWVLRKWLILS